jgi:serine/threonine protein kinase
MTANPAPAPVTASSLAIAPGQVVGGRFQVEDTASADALGVVLRARDQKTNRPIALRVVTPALVASDAAQNGLKTECRTAAQLTHKNVVGTYGVGAAQGSQFVACEWVDGVPLSRLVETKNQEGTKLSLRGAYNVIAHVANALTKAHETTVHGALRPSVVWVTKSGRVKVGDFGIGRAILVHNGANALGAAEQACLAPEVKAGRAPDARSDIFGLGALLYTMLTGRSPADGFVPPSQAHPDASQAIDQVLLKCLAADPAARFESPDQVRHALAPLVADAPEVPPEQDFAIDIDVSIESEVDEDGPTTRDQPKVKPRPAPPGAPKVGQRVSIHEEFRASAVSIPMAAPKAAAVSAEVDLKGLLAKITENDAPRWMVVKDNLDHGPFSGRELVQSILKGEVLEDHGLLNMDTGERKKVKGFPEFTEFLAQHKAEKRAREEKQALERSEKVETASNVGKIFMGVGLLVVILAGVGIFLYTREEAGDQEVADAALADLYDRGEIEIEGSAGILPTPPPRRGGRGGGRRAGGGGGLTYEDAMNQAVNLGDVSQGGGGERQLTSADVAGVMNRNINTLFGCVGQELRGGGSLSEVQIDLAIAGSGQVLGASVRQGSPGFKSCIQGRVRGIRFPSFPAPRMGARYRFNVD